MDAGRVVTLDAHHHQDGDCRRERTKMHDVTVLVLRLDLGFGAKGSSRWMRTSSTKMLDAHHHKNAEMHLGAKMQKTNATGCHTGCAPPLEKWRLETTKMHGDSK